MIAGVRRGQVTAKAKQYGLDPNNQAHRLIAAEEVLAEMAQTTPGLGFVRRAVAAIRAWMRQNVPGFQGLRVSDAEIIRNYILPARAFVERGAGVRVGGEPMFSRSAMKSVDANISRGREAMNRAIIDKADQHRAMYRHDLGWVDFVWGDSKRGLSHILTQRQEKDGMSPEAATRFALDGLVQTIARGTSSRRIEIEGSTALHVDFNGARAILVRNHGSNAWMLTGFEMRAPDGKREGFDSQKPTLAESTPTRDGQGAGKPIVAEHEVDGKSSGDTPMFSRAATADEAGLNNPRDFREKAQNAVNDLFRTPGVVSWWHKTVGTMHDLAERSPSFKRVYDSVQSFLQDVSYYATEAADLAPRILPKLDSLSDLKKSALSA